MPNLPAAVMDAEPSRWDLSFRSPPSLLMASWLSWAPSALEEARIHPCLKRKSAMSLEHPCTFFLGICQDYNALIALTQAISLGSICSNQPWGMRSCLPPGLREGCCKTTGSPSWMLLSCDANLLYLWGLQLHLHETKTKGIDLHHAACCVESEKFLSLI